MKLLRSSVLGLTVALGAMPSVAAAQAPDIRNVRPVVMLLVDTSGSMEYATGQPNGTEPICTGSSNGSNTRSRWATVLEALTGSWSNFSCSRIGSRRSAYPGATDQNYHLPHFTVPSTGQNTDGILDAYAERAKFGLMTVDAIFGLQSYAEGYVPQSVYMSRLLEASSAGGMYSYGERRPFTFPGCGDTFMVDGGSRSASAASGALISVGSDATDPRVTNALIQAELLAMRPSHGTATGAMLDDFRYYIQHDNDVNLNDPLNACRPKYAILISDGQDDDYFRRANCGVGGTVCPYDQASVIANDLCQYSSSASECTGDINGLFVVGFGADEVGAQARLDDIADRGGTTAARMANDRLSLISALSTVLDQANPGTTTRTAPVYASGAATTAGAQQQYRFNSGFVVGSASSDPWSGVLERTRYECDASLIPQPQTLVPSRDNFGTILNNRSSERVLYTVATGTANEMTGFISGTSASLATLPASSGGGGVSRSTNRSLTPFETSNVALTPAHFGITGGTVSSQTARRDAVIHWVHARAGSGREALRLGDIYHSTPVTVGPPRSDLADESFNLFRRRTDVATRPTVVYVGTNDGILHAFATEDMTIGARTIREGEELWGFVPPAIVPRLETATASHQILVDGPPVVRDVFFQRFPGAQPTALASSAGSYRTVLTMGLRGGGNSYFALDVTDPLNPIFLWQFTAANMGSTYAKPAVGQLLMELSGVVQERAVAILPGGVGAVDPVLSLVTGASGCVPAGFGAAPVTQHTNASRARQRCWGRRGRDVYVVDVVTGELLRAIDASTFNAPMTGAASLFVGDTAAIATRAFMSDDDGVIWRLDFSSRLPSAWNARPFHDIYWNAAPTVAQPSYEPPIVSSDSSGNVVVIQGTGNPDVFDSPSAQNRVVSLTEKLTFGSTPTVAAELNWELVLHAGEQVTGSVELFDGAVYFSTFESSSGSDACAYGQSRIWGVEYLESDTVAPAGYTTASNRNPKPHFESVEGSGTFDEHFLGPYSNEIVMGVAVTQTITCVAGAFRPPDPYLGQQYSIAQTGGGTFSLTAQISGRNGASAPGSSSVRTVSRSLPTPASFTRLLSWVPQADL